MDEKMKVRLISFGYKYGIPEGVNFLWDVRFLPNPYWDEELRPKTGLEDVVSNYIVGSEEGQGFINLLKPLLLYLTKQNIVKDKGELVIALGCTGGRHRSVAMAEVLKDVLTLMPVKLECIHRDIERDAE